MEQGYNTALYNTLMGNASKGYDAIGRTYGSGNVDASNPLGFFAKRAGSIENAIGTTLMAPVSGLKDTYENWSTAQQRRDWKGNIDDVYRKYGFRNKQDYDDQIYAAENSGNQAEADRLLNLAGLQKDLQAVANSNAAASKAKADDYTAWRTDNSYLNQKINQDENKFLGSAMNTLSTGVDVLGLGAGPVSNAIQGAWEGVADELEQNGRDFDWSRAGQNALTGAATGAATGAFNKALGATKFGGGRNLFKGSNKFTKGLNDLGSKTALGRFGSTVATGMGRGALSGAVGGATGAGLQAALNNQDILSSAAQGALQGARGGAVSGGVMAGINMGISRTPFMQKVQEAQREWNQSGKNFSERWNNTLDSEKGFVGKVAGDLYRAWGQPDINNESESGMRGGYVQAPGAESRIGYNDYQNAMNKLNDYLSADSEGIPQTAPAYARVEQAYDDAVNALRSTYTDDQLADMLRGDEPAKIKSVVQAAMRLPETTSKKFLGGYVQAPGAENIDLDNNDDLLNEAAMRIAERYADPNDYNKFEDEVKNASALIRDDVKTYDDLRNLLRSEGLTYDEADRVLGLNNPETEVYDALTKQNGNRTWTDRDLQDYDNPELARNYLERIDELNARHQNVTDDVAGRRYVDEISRLNEKLLNMQKEPQSKMPVVQVPGAEAENNARQKYINGFYEMQDSDNRGNNGISDRVIKKVAETIAEIDPNARLNSPYEAAYDLIDESQNLSQLKNNILKTYGAFLGEADVDNLLGATAWADENIKLDQALAGSQNNNPIDNFDFEGSRINYDDDLVITYDKNGNVVYQGIVDNDPMKNENWKWDEKTHSYKSGEYTQVNADGARKFNNGGKKFLGGYVQAPGATTENEDLSPGAQKVINAFDNSSNQQVITNRDGRDFAIGDFGNDNLARKTDKINHGLTIDEIKTVIDTSDTNTRSGDSSFRKDNTAWFGTLPNGERATVITRVNALGQNEIIDAYKNNPGYEAELISKFGTPARSRTENLGLERPGAKSVAGSNGSIIAQDSQNVNALPTESETEVYRQLTAQTGNEWDDIAKQNGYRNYDEAVQNFLRANPGAEANANNVLDWMDQDLMAGKKTFSQAKSGDEIKYERKIVEEITDQFNPVSAPTKRSTRPNETFKGIYDELGLSDGNDIRKAVHYAEPGELVPTIIREAAGRAGVVDLTDAQQMVQDLKLNKRQNYTKTLEVLEDIIDSTPSTISGGKSGVDALELQRTLEKMASDARGTNGTYRIGNKVVDQTTANNMMRIARNIGENLDKAAADTGAVQYALNRYAPELQEMKGAFQGNEKWGKWADDVANAKTIKQLRSSIKNLTRASIFIEDGDNTYGTMGSRTARGVGLNGDIPTTKRGLINRGVNAIVDKIENTPAARNARLKRYTEQRSKAQQARIESANNPATLETLANPTTPTDTTDTTEVVTGEVVTPQSQQLWNAIGRTEGALTGQQARTGQYLVQAANDTNDTTATTGATYGGTTGATSTMTTEQEKAKYFFPPTGQYWPDMLSQAMRNARNAGDNEALGALYEMYQDAIKGNSSSENLTDKQRQANAAQLALQNFENAEHNLAYDLSDIPVVGGIANLGGNDYLSQAESLALQVGYMLSGATVNKDEARKIGMAYVPQPRDNEAVRRDKIQRLRGIISEYQRTS